MDIGSILNFAVGAVIALALGWIGFQEWQKASHEQRLATIRKIVLAGEEYAKHSGIKGADKLAWAMARLEMLFPKAAPSDLDEEVHAVVAELNAAKKQGTPTGRSAWYE
ncbi:MAG: hypothetical protein E6R03_14300 [Hyphomicrobiaceae bacterium]|nr:MAG: hypothetical protein E6R03_14300 [Hyphomicrobiaceae bacterium]